MPKGIFIFHSGKNYFPLGRFSIQGPETTVQGPETPVQGP